jgi:nicotinamidase-related amidase
MAHRFGFFDVDSRELDDSGRALGYRPRVLPIAPKLERLYALAETRGYPLVFTTCCSGRMPAPENLPDILHVPLDESDASWRAAVGTHQRFYLAKRTCGDPKLNYNARTFDMFQHNPNARLLLQSLDVETWVVFGNGFDLCVASAANGILGAGLPLILLEDVRISSAGGTPASEAETLRRLRERGARIMTLEAFLRQKAP